MLKISQVSLKATNEMISKDDWDEQSFQPIINEIHNSLMECEQPNNRLNKFKLSILNINLVLI